ncbi:transposase [Saccharopolyspora hattusasensis]|uniref:transposase n=1 Tax=Saccharopolyspora hattusasensis TaxID=1128679 RepID=UPI003D994769
MRRSRGRALVDRELYLPASWTGDRQRLAEAGIDDDVKFATKPQLAQRMLEHLLDSDAGAGIGWFTTDEAARTDSSRRTRTDRTP